jgi:D-3-phosphoglycerate dehydrogenase
MAAVQLDDYLRNGNIRNSVNYPNVSMPRTPGTRICVMHDNIPAILSKISGVMGDLHINIDNMINKSKGDNAYTMLDVAGTVSADVVAKLTAVDGIVKVRVI